MGFFFLQKIFFQKLCYVYCEKASDVRNSNPNIKLILAESCKVQYFFDNLNNLNKMKSRFCDTSNNKLTSNDIVLTCNSNLLLLTVYFINSI